MHVLGEAGIAVDHSLNGGHRRLVVRLGIDGDPELAGIDPHDLVTRHGAAQMGADVRDPRHGPQLSSRLRHDARHRRMRGAGRAHPVDHQMPLLERRQEGLPEHRPRRESDRDQHDRADDCGAWSVDRPSQQPVIAVLQPPDERRRAVLDGRLAEENNGQRRSDGQRDRDRGDDRQHIRNSQRREEGARQALHEEDGSHHEQDDQRRVEHGSAHLERRVTDDRERRLIAAFRPALPKPHPDVLDDDDGIVDDDSDGDHEPREHHRIERGAPQAQHDAGGQQGQWDRDDADQRGPPRGHEGAQREHDEHTAEEQSDSEIFERHLDERCRSKDPGVDVHSGEPEP